MIEPKVMEFSEGEYVLHSDYARLKAEVERLTFDPLTYLDDQGEWMPRHTHLAAVERLKAEVERLTELNATISLRYDATKSMLDGCAKEIEEMEAEIERLTSDLQMEKENEDRLVRLHQDARNEVERLTKAGDALGRQVLILMLKGGASDALIRAYNDWRDVSIGKPNFHPHKK
jgi:Mg2+ and Co2+ transporter CorA